MQRNGLSVEGHPRIGRLGRAPLWVVLLGGLLTIHGSLSAGCGGLGDAHGIISIRYTDVQVGDADIVGASRIAVLSTDTESQRCRIRFYDGDAPPREMQVEVGDHVRKSENVFGNIILYAVKKGAARFQTYWPG